MASFCRLADRGGQGIEAWAVYCQRKEELGKLDWRCFVLDTNINVWVKNNLSELLLWYAGFCEPNLEDLNVEWPDPNDL